jgi:Na+-driven multidrug efflux pump
MLGPFSIAVIALISTGIVDTIYLGRLTDPARPDLAIMALAALTIGFPLTFMGNSANIGLGAGTMSAVSRALGQGDTEKAKRHAAAAILLALTVMSLLVAFMFAMMPYFLALTGASEEVSAMAMGYLMITMPGLVIVSIASMANNILRAYGEAILPSSIMILSAVVNIIVDPFLIFG